MRRSTTAASAVVLAASLAVSALAQTPALTPAAKDAADAFIARIETLKSKTAAMPPAASLEEALQRRFRLDQAVLGFEGRGLSPQEQMAALSVIRPVQRAVQADNATFLKSVIPAEGWFRLSRDGASVGRSAFMIVQHMQDLGWQKEVLAKMEPLLAQKEVGPQEYAMLYDRVQMNQGLRQRFGTQAECRGDRMAIAEMEAPEQVQQRRDAIGLKSPPYPSFEEFKGLFANIVCDERAWRQLNRPGG